jgi:hypothetical protein
MCIDVMENFKLSVNDDDNDMGGVTIENSTRFVQKKTKVWKMRGTQLSNTMIIASRIIYK